MPSSAFKKCDLRSEEHTSELQSLTNLVCRLLLEKKHMPKISEWSTVPSSVLFSFVLTSMFIETPCWISKTFSSFPLFFFNDTATTETYTFSLHDALPI